MNLCSGKKSQVNHNENKFVYHGCSIGEVNPANRNQSQDTKVTTELLYLPNREELQSQLDMLIDNR